MVEVMREKYIHTLGYFTSPRPYDPVIKQSCEGRDSVQDLKTSHNNLDVNLPQLAAEPKANLLVYVINQLRDLENNVYHTYGYITKANRIKLGSEKSHTNDAFVMAGGKIQNRCKSFIVKQNRRNSRKLQTNRKGFKPSIRRRRYEFQPGSLVKLNNKIYTTKGIFNLGKWIRLEDKQGKILNVNIKKVSLLVYQKGFAFGY